MADARADSWQTLGDLARTLERGGDQPAVTADALAEQGEGEEHHQRITQGLEQHVRQLGS